MAISVDYINDVDRYNCFNNFPYLKATLIAKQGAIIKFESYNSWIQKYPWGSIGWNLITIWIWILLLSGPETVLNAWAENKL